MALRLDAAHSVLKRTGTPDGWREASVGDLARIVGGGTPDREQSAYWRDGTVPWITPTDLTANGAKYIASGSETISHLGLENSNATLVPKDSIVFSTRGTVGSMALAAAPLTCNQSCEILVPRDGAVDADFLFYLLHYGLSAFIRLSGGTTFGAITRRDIARVRFAVPPQVEEQAAIASILAAVDTALEGTRVAAERTRDLRRALMQELIPPWIGLRELTGYQKPAGVEEIVRADIVTDVCNGSTPSRSEGRYWRQGTIPWLPTGKVHDRIITAADEFVTEAALGECSIRLLPRGTVLVGMIGQGRTRGMSAYLDIAACINQNFGAFTPRSLPTPRVWGKWLFYFLDFHYSRVREAGGGTNQGALNCYLLKRLRLPLPAFDRQREVAAILDGVESLERARLTALTLWGDLKKSLMHDLLTGRVRVMNEMKAAAS
jgi:type I restriction enzyme, S subunit